MPRSVVILVLSLASLLACARPVAARVPCVVRAPLDGVVNAGTASYLTDAVGHAERLRCEAVLVTLDTPGGMLEATRSIVRAFLGSKVPIIVYVAPAGARAGSAGAFVTLAAHVAAMAPGTNIGAAHPVTGGGEDPEKSGGKHLGNKVENDTAALARSIAKQRGRNAEWAEKAVRDGSSATSEEALQLNVVDMVAPDLNTLIAQLNGRQVTLLDGREIVLNTHGATVNYVEMKLIEDFLYTIADPNIAYLLLSLAMLGIMVEIFNPGLIFPGVVGAISLLLAFLHWACCRSTGLASCLSPWLSASSSVRC